MTNLYRPDYLPRLTPTPNAFALNTPQDATTYHPMTRTQYVFLSFLFLKISF